MSRAVKRTGSQASGKYWATRAGELGKRNGIYSGHVLELTVVRKCDRASARTPHQIWGGAPSLLARGWDRSQVQEGNSWIKVLCSEALWSSIKLGWCPYLVQQPIEHVVLVGFARFSEGRTCGLGWERGSILQNRYGDFFEKKRAKDKGP